MDLDRIRTKLDDTVGSIASTEALDRVADPLARVVRRGLRSTNAGPVLRGEFLGHPLHPALTDLPVGFWTSAWFLDFGGRRASGAATAMVALGLVSVPPTVASGLADWVELDRTKRRLGVVHLAANATATLLYAASLSARLRRRRARGIALSWAGATAATLGAYLGGHLSFASTPSSASPSAATGAEQAGIVDQQGAVLDELVDVVGGPTAATTAAPR